MFGGVAGSWPADNLGTYWLLPSLLPIIPGVYLGVNKHRNVSKGNAQRKIVGVCTNDYLVQSIEVLVAQGIAVFVWAFGGANHDAPPICICTPNVYTQSMLRRSTLGLLVSRQWRCVPDNEAATI